MYKLDTGAVLVRKPPCTEACIPQAAFLALGMDSWVKCMSSNVTSPPALHTNKRGKPCTPSALCLEDCGIPYSILMSLPTWKVLLQKVSSFQKAGMFPPSLCPWCFMTKNNIQMVNLWERDLETMCLLSVSSTVSGLCADSLCSPDLGDFSSRPWASVKGTWALLGKGPCSRPGCIKPWFVGWPRLHLSRYLSLESSLSDVQVQSSHRYVRACSCPQRELWKVWEPMRWKQFHSR